MPDRPTSSTPPMRGRRGRDRRIAEQVAAEFAARHAPPTEDDTRDFDVAAVDAEVEDARAGESRAASRAPKRRATPAPSAAPGPAIDSRISPHCRRSSTATGTFASLQERLGTPADLGRVGRHAGLVAVPHGAKSFLAAAIATTEPLVWIARDAEVGDRVAEELGAWLGDPAAVASWNRGPRSPTNAANSWPTRRRPGWRPCRPGDAAGRACSWPASRPSSSTRSRPTTCPRARASCAWAPGSTRTPCCGTCSTSATRP